MHPSDREQADGLDALARAVASWTVDLMHERDPSLEQRYGQDGSRLWRGEVESLVRHLAEAIAARRAALFVCQATWSRAGFVARDVTTADLQLCLECLREVLESQLPADVALKAIPLVDEGLAAMAVEEGLPSSVIAADKPNSSLARLYLLHLLQRDQSAAANTIFEAHREGKSLCEIYETIIGPALTEVGRMWHLQEASIADEHYCSAATQMIMAQLRARMSRKPSIGKRMLATCVGGDLHDIGLRMVTDLFDADGWETEYLGANMPVDEIVASLIGEDGYPAYDLLAVSVGTALSVRAVASLIDAIRASPSVNAIPIMVGGRPFRIVADLWKVVGADAYAPDAASSLSIARRLVGHETARS